jgi:hypothetical protein
MFRAVRETIERATGNPVRFRANAYGADPVSASAFSSQKVMPISRYIVHAVVRCSRAFAWSPVRR